ncbi:radical SAM family heme chaperone HemW [Fuscibacter oryzae]|uniref:Heme chaperone HemW n=1 Tax=Fuscibacter oryzae TaxID=2803939 RepID=A0A8J7MRB5_9RHOB|nr:radical SAM family heme chaperone HemW [Fuscibacter oryzae]MBL4929067.1 coproporphyrinogen III oxidase [Fuscibacter oryzae]
MEDWRHGGFGLYIHWPFCQSKCPYCDFNSHVASSVDQDKWLTAYLREIDRLAAETKGRVLSSVFFGGGTPSLMNPEVVSGVIDHVRRSWPMTNSAEITLEANPGSVEAGRFSAYRQAGVNRISMGIQALNDEALRKLGRLHTAPEALKAFGIARDLFDRVSFDLIYARQEQTVQDWRAELRLALSYAIDHLSLYQLTIEEGTPFAARLLKGGLTGLPDEDRAVALFEATQEICDAAGLPSYEVSNHARPGAESQHNLIYWRGGDYVGIGPGAHGRLTLDGVRVATECPRAPDTWLNSRTPELPRMTLSALEHAEEYVLMSLRLSEGLEMDRLINIRGKAPNYSVLNELKDQGLLLIENGRLTATPRGRMLLNAVIEKVAVSLA